MKQSMLLLLIILLVAISTNNCLSQTIQQPVKHKTLHYNSDLLRKQNTMCLAVLQVITEFIPMKEDDYHFLIVYFKDGGNLIIQNESDQCCVEPGDKLMLGDTIVGFTDVNKYYNRK